RLRVPEPVEHVRQVQGWNTRSAVAYGEPDAGTLPLLACQVSRQRYAAAGRRKLHGIAEQIGEYLLQPVWVGIDLGQIGGAVDGKLQSLLFSERLEHRSHRLHQIRDGSRLACNREWAGIQAHSIQEITDDLS